MIFLLGILETEDFQSRKGRRQNVKNALKEEASLTKGKVLTRSLAFGQK